MTVRGAVAVLAAVVALASCGPRAPADPGVTALMTVAGAQFYPGAAPDDRGGPAVMALQNSRSVVTPGLVGKPLTGAVGGDANAVAISLAGDRGFWVVPAGAPDVDMPGQLTFDVRLSFSAKLGPGPGELRVQAGDRTGRYGAAATSAITIAPAPAPSGTLVFTLDWDSDADLDLHVVDPTGAEVWAGNINSEKAPLPGQPPDPDVAARGGVLDADSNAGCVLDARLQESVVWTEEPPAGRYLVRVDTFSLCGEAGAAWTATATLHGQRVGLARGVARESDTRFAHGLGAGVTAFAIDVTP